MSIEREPSHPTDFGSLQGCFVEGSGAQRARERRIRRRALIISVSIQSAILAAIILIPLFGKPEHIALAMTPLPPYFHSPARPPADPATAPPSRPTPNLCATCYSPSYPQHPQTHVDNDPPGEPLPPGISPGSGPDAPCPGCIAIDDGRRQPQRPADERPQVPKRLVLTRLEPAMLIHRVEPEYPPLAKQTHREGRVELHAIIATDGTIQFLQVVSGDQLFLRSALDAVGQWRYRPTVLNGQPVEIDTFITVVFTLRY